MLRQHWKANASGIKWAQTRDTARHSPTHRKPPHPKNHPAPNVHSSKVEKFGESKPLLRVDGSVWVSNKSEGPLCRSASHRHLYETSALRVWGPGNLAEVQRTRLGMSVLEEMPHQTHSRHQTEREPEPTVARCVMFRKPWEGHLDLCPSSAVLRGSDSEGLGRGPKNVHF